MSSWTIEPFDAAFNQNASDSDSILSESDDYPSHLKVPLPEDEDDELRQIMNTANDYHDNQEMPHANIVADVNKMPQKPAPIQQRRKSERIMKQNKEKDKKAKNTTPRVNKGGRSKSNSVQKSTVGKDFINIDIESLNDIDSHSLIYDDETDPDWVPWNSKSGKRKFSETQNHSRSKTKLTSYLWKYFTDIQRLDNGIDKSSDNITSAVDDGDLAIDPSNANETSTAADSNSKMIRLSARCTICNERKQFQKASVWNLRNHLNKVCSIQNSSKFNFNLLKLIFSLLQITLSDSFFIPFHSYHRNMLTFLMTL